MSVNLTGNGIKTSAFLIPDTKSMTFETAVMRPVSQRLVVHRTEFDGWLAVAPFDPGNVLVPPKIVACLDDESGCFSLPGIVISNNQSDSLVLTVVYRPLSEGTHTATIVLTGHKAHPVYVELTGTAYMPDPGDVDGDGEINIRDVTGLVDLLLAGDEEELPPYADLDGDGSVSISDITRLIDHFLGH